MRLFLLAVLAGCCSWLSGATDDRVKVDNEFVRILKVTDEPHHPSALHEHEFNRVMIYLDNGDLLLTYADGRQDRQHWKAGQVAWSPAYGKHTSENVGASPVRIVEIELKKPAPVARHSRSAKLDAVVLDPKHNTVLLDNAQVRVFRSWREPGGTEPLHAHEGAGRASVLLTDMQAQVKLSDGTATTQQGKAGDVSWSGPVTHATSNLGRQKLEVLVVEVK